MSTDSQVSDRKKTFLLVLMSFIQGEALSSCHSDFFSVILNELKNLIPSHNVHQN